MKETTQSHASLTREPTVPIAEVSLGHWVIRPPLVTRQLCTPLSTSICTCARLRVPGCCSPKLSSTWYIAYCTSVCFCYVNQFTVRAVFLPSQQKSVSCRHGDSEHRSREVVSFEPVLHPQASLSFGMELADVDFAPQA